MEEKDLSKYPQLKEDSDFYVPLKFWNEAQKYKDSIKNLTQKRKRVLEEFVMTDDCLNLDEIHDLNEKLFPKPKPVATDSRENARRKKAREDAKRKARKENVDKATKRTILPDGRVFEFM